MQHSESSTHPDSAEHQRTRAPARWLRWLALAGGLALAMGGVALPAGAADWYAAPSGGGSDCTQAAPCTIQGAIDKAGEYDTVHVGAGDYSFSSNRIVIETEGLQLIGENSPFAKPYATPPGTGEVAHGSFDNRAADASVLKAATSNASGGGTSGMIWVRNVKDVRIENLYIEVYSCTGFFGLSCTARAKEGIVATGNVNGLELINNYIKFTSGTSAVGISVNVNAGSNSSVPSDETRGGSPFVTVDGNVLEPTPGGFSSAGPKYSIGMENATGAFLRNQVASHTSDMWLKPEKAASGNAPEQNVFLVEENWFFGRLGLYTAGGSGFSAPASVSGNHFVMTETQGDDTETHQARLMSGPPTIVGGNTFTGFRGRYAGLWIQNRPDVSVIGNTFEPLANQSDFRAIVVGNWSIQTGTPPAPKPFDVTIQGNTFLANGAPSNNKGKAILFVDDNDADGDADFAQAIIGGTGAGEANEFDAGIRWYIALDDRTCNGRNHASTTSGCNGGSGYVIGQGINYTAATNSSSNSQKRPFEWDVQAEGNIFGGVAMATMDEAQYDAVRGKTFDTSHSDRTDAAVGNVVYNWLAPGTVVFDPVLPAASVYSGAAQPVTAELLEDSSATCEISYAPGGSNAPELPGAYTVTAECVGTTHHGTATGLFTIVKIEEAITGFAADPAEPVYSDGGTFTVSATATGSSEPLVFGSNTSGTCSVVDDTVTMLAAGTCTLTANQAGDGNYEAAPEVTLDVTIGKGAGGVSWGDLDFDYNGSSYAVTATHAGSGASCTVAPGEVGPSVGSREVTATCDGGANYEDASETRTASVGGDKVVRRLPDGAEFASVAEALADDDTGTGDTLEIAPGTYSGTIDLYKGVRLQPMSGGIGIMSAGPTTPPAVIFDGGGSVQDGIAISAPDASVSGFEFKNYARHCVFVTAGSDNVTVEQNLLHGCGNSGVWVNGTIDGVTIDHNQVHDFGFDVPPGTAGGRGIVVWNGSKTNITITNNDVYDGAGCCGIELQDGTASGVTITGNTVDGGGTGIGAKQLTSGAGPNVITNNTITNMRHTGIEIKNPNGTGAESGDGSIVISDNIISRDTSYNGTDSQDVAGIAVFRRDVYTPDGEVDVVTGVVIRDNTITGMVPRAGNDNEGYGIAVEGTNSHVYGNTVKGGHIGIQVQQGNPATQEIGNTGVFNSDGNTNNEFFSRGSTELSCVNVGVNTFDGVAVADYRNVTADNDGDPMVDAAAPKLDGGVHNTRTGGYYCSIQKAVDEADAGDTIEVDAGLYAENVVVNKELTINGPFAGTHGNDGDRGGSDEAVIHPDSGVAVLLRADDVTINGFTIGSDNGHAVRRNGGSYQNLSLINNRIEDVIGGSGFFSEPGGSHTSDGLVISHNRFSNISGSGASAGRGIALFKGTTSTLVEDNDLVGPFGFNAVQMNAGNGVVDGVMFRDNQISASAGSALVMLGTSNSTVTGNTIQNVSGALFLSDGTSNLAVSCNSFSVTGTAVSAQDFSFGSNGGIQIFHNAISAGNQDVSSTMGEGLLIGSNWYGGAAAAISSTSVDVLVADPLLSTPIGEADCGNNTPVEIVTYGSTGTQSAAVDTQFDDLRARVQDALGGAVMGQGVSFAAPTNGASATLVPATGTTNYNGELIATATANSVAGSYEVTATSGSFTTNPAFALTNTQGIATVDVTTATVTYDGDPHGLSVTTVPGGLEGDVQLDYGGGITCAAAAAGCGPTDAGIYSVTATIVGNDNYAGSGTGTLTIKRAPTTIEFLPDPLSFVYDGSSNHVVSARLTDEPDTTCPVTGTVGPDVGNYPVSASACTGDNYEAPAATATAEITKAAATVTLSHLKQPHDGAPKSVLVTTDPAGLNVDITYDGSSTPPTDVGSYTVEATVDDTNYSGTASGTLEIVAGQGDISVVVNGPVDPIHVDEHAQFAATMLANPALHTGETFFFDMMLSKSGGDALDIDDITGLEVFYGGSWMDAFALTGGDIGLLIQPDGNGNLTYRFPLGVPGYDNGFPILDASWTWNVRFTFGSTGTYTSSWTLIDAVTLDPIDPIVTGSATVVVQDALPPTDIHLVMTGPQENVEVGQMADYTATMLADSSLHTGDKFDILVRIAKTGGNHALEVDDLAAMEVFFDTGSGGSWQPFPTGAFTLDSNGELVLLFPSFQTGDGFEIEDDQWTWHFRTAWGDTGTYTLTAHVVPYGDPTQHLATAAISTDVVDATPHLPDLTLLLNGPLDDIELGVTAQYTGALLGEPLQHAGDQFWVRIRISKSGGNHALEATDLATMELHDGSGWQDHTGTLQPQLQPDGADLVYLFPQPFGPFEIEDPIWSWNFRFTYGDTGEYTAQADLIDAADTDPLAAPALASASTTTSVIDTPQIVLSLQGALTGTVGTSIEYLGTLTADPLPPASDLHYVEVRIQRDGGPADPSDIDKAEILWPGQGGWIDPVADLGQSIPWFVDGDDLVYLFPQPILAGFPIDEPTWSWRFRFTYANAGQYTASATVVTADGSATPVSNTATILTEVAPQVSDIVLSLQGALGSTVGVPVEYLGTLTADPLPDPADLHYVEVRIQRDGGPADPSDLQTAEIFWGDWIDPVADLGQSIPWTVDGNDLVYLFPKPVMNDGFPIVDPSWEWRFRFTYANEGVYTAAATVISAADGTPVSNTATILTEVGAQLPITAQILFDPASLQATYDGDPHAASASTDPAGLTLSYTYGGDSTVPTNAGSYLVEVTVVDAVYVGSATAVLTIDKASGSISFAPLSAPYGTEHMVTASLDQTDTNVICDPVAGVPAQDAPVGSYTLSASCTSDNYTASGTASYEVTPSGVQLWPTQAAPVGVVTVDSQPDADSRMSYYSWDSSGSADELVRADFVVTTTNANAQAGDLEAEWSDGSQWHELPMDFDATSGSWSQTFGPVTGFEPGQGASDFRVAFHRGGSYTFDASLVGVDSGLTLAASTPVITQVAELQAISAPGAMATKVGVAVDTSLTLANTGTAALSSGGSLYPAPPYPDVDAQPAPNDQNVRARITIERVGGQLEGAPTIPGDSPDAALQYYNDLTGTLDSITLRADSNGHLYGHFGALENGGLAVPVGFTGTNQFRINFLSYTGTYKVKWELVGVNAANQDTGVVYASSAEQTFEVDAGEAYSIALISGNPQSAEVGTAFGDPLVVQVLDIGGNPVAEAAVAFSAEAAGNGASIGTDGSDTSDGDGYAQFLPTANTVAGSYTVRASISNGDAVEFELTNTAAAAAGLQIVSGDAQSAVVGESLTAELVVQLVDQHGNAVATPEPGETVVFEAPDSGASTDPETVSVQTDTSGQASSGPLTANLIAGTYDVEASSGTLDTATFKLTNTEGTIQIDNIRWVDNGSGTIVFDDSDQAVIFDLTPSSVDAGSCTVTYNAGSTLPRNVGQYVVQVTCIDDYGSGSGNATLQITQATVDVTLDDLTATYDGTAHFASVSTDPAGVSGVSLSYEQGGTPVLAPIDAGTYDVTVALSNPNYDLGTVTGSQLTIAPKQVTATFADLSHVYDGSPKEASVSFDDPAAGIPAPTLSYAPVSPTDVGSYTVSVSLNNANYELTGSDTATLEITQAGGSIDLGTTSFEFDGTAHDITPELTDEAGNCTVTVVDGEYPRTNAGSTELEVACTGNNHSATTTATLTVVPKAVSIELSDTGAFTYDGSDHAATATVNGEVAGYPADVDISYNGDPTPPNGVGNYQVLAQLAASAANYTAAPAPGLISITKSSTGNITFDPLSGQYGTVHAVTATLDEDSSASCTVSGTPVQSDPVGDYPISAVCISSNYEVSGTATYEVTPSGVQLWPEQAAPVGVVTVDPQPDADSRMSYYSWDSSGSADELVRADFVVSSGNANAQAGDLKAEWFDPSDNSWQPLPMDFDAASGSWSQTFGPVTGFEPGQGASDFRVVFHRGGSYTFDASLVGVDSGLTLATSDPVVTEVAEITLSGLSNSAGQVGQPVSASMTLANTGTAALSSGAIPLVAAQPAPNDENVRGRFFIEWDGGALAPATQNGCGDASCASEDVAIEFYDADEQEWVHIYNLRQTDDGQGLYGHFGALTKHGVPVPAGYSGNYLFRVTAKHHTGTYTITPQVVGLDSGTVYAEADSQEIGIDSGEAYSIELISGDGQHAVVDAAFAAPLVVEVRDMGGNLVDGAAVVFNATAAINGASSDNGSGTSDVDGLAQFTPTANTIATAAGANYTVRASIANGEHVDFVLWNDADDHPDQVQISAAAGNGQTAQVQTQYGLELKARVSDRFGNSLKDVQVSFAAPTDGPSAMLPAATATSDGDGLASIGQPIANDQAGAFAVSATLDGADCNAASTDAHCETQFLLVNTAGGAASLTLSSSAGSATVGTAAAYTLTAQVRDAQGNPVPGVSVTFTGQSAGAGIDPTTWSGNSNSAGEVVHAFDANTTAGDFQVLATASGALDQSVNLQNLPGAAAQLELVDGDGQKADVETAFAQQLQVRVLDQHDNPVADDAAAAVQFAAQANDGASATLNPQEATSGSGGLAATEATANDTAGSYTVVATLAGTSQSVSFGLTNEATVEQVAISGIQWSTGGSSVIYDGNEHQATAEVQDHPDATVTFTYNGDTALPTEAGTYTVVATVDEDGLEGSASAELVIEQAQATVQLIGGNYEEDGNPHPAVVIVEPAAAGDTGATNNGVLGSLTYAPGGTSAPLDAGTYEATFEVTGLANSNYKVDEEMLTATIRIFEATDPDGNCSIFCDGFEDDVAAH